MKNNAKRWIISTVAVLLLTLIIHNLASKEKIDAAVNETQPSETFLIVNLNHNTDFQMTRKEHLS